MGAFSAPETQSAVTENNLDMNIVEKQTVTWYGRMETPLAGGAPSTTRPPLRCGVLWRKTLWIAEVFGEFIENLPVLDDLAVSP